MDVLCCAMPLWYGNAMVFLVLSFPRMPLGTYARHSTTLSYDFTVAIQQVSGSYSLVEVIPSV